MPQLALNLELKNKSQFLEEDFCHLPENASAFLALEKFFSQNHNNSIQIPSIILLGEKSSGKTHILNIFSQKHQENCEFLPKNEVPNINLADFFKKNRFYILEDFDKIQDEELLFHIFNAALVAQAFLVMSGEKMPEFQLKDLISRFKNIVTTKINNLSPDSLKVLLVAIFSNKQIRISSKLIDFLVRNIDRSYGSVFLIIEKIEDFYNENAAPPKVGDLKNIMTD